MSVGSQPRSRARARASILLLIPVLIVVSACSSAAASSATPASMDAAARSATTVASGAGAGVPAGTPDAAGIGAPAQAGGGTGLTGTSAGGTASNAAIAYPYPGYPGSSGVAPAHTIVVTGVGNAAIKADGSNRSTAQRTALAAALADAKAQADLVAQATGVTIKGVLSVSVSTGQAFAYPIMAGLEGSAPGKAPDGTTVTPPAPGIVRPAAPQLEVSVTVAYQIG